jgi:hypothetical protein
MAGRKITTFGHSDGVVAVVKNGRNSLPVLYVQKQYCEALGLTASLIGFLFQQLVMLAFRQTVQ